MRTPTCCGRSRGLTLRRVRGGVIQHVVHIASSDVEAARAGWALVGRTRPRPSTALADHAARRSGHTGSELPGPRATARGSHQGSRARQGSQDPPREGDAYGFCSWKWIECVGSRSCPKTVYRSIGSSGTLEERGDSLLHDIRGCAAFGSLTHRQGLETTAVGVIAASPARCGFVRVRRALGFRGRCPGVPPHRARRTRRSRD